MLGPLFGAAGRRVLQQRALRCAARRETASAGSHRLHCAAQAIEEAADPQLLTHPAEAGLTEAGVARRRRPCCRCQRWWTEVMWPKVQLRGSEVPVNAAGPRDGLTKLLLAAPAWPMGLSDSGKEAMYAVTAIAGGKGRGRRRSGNRRSADRGTPRAAARASCCRQILLDPASHFARWAGR